MSLTPFFRSPFATFFDDDDWFFAPVKAHNGRRQGALQGQQTSMLSPKLDMIETKDGQLVITAELPGLKKEDVDVQLSNGHLTISGKVERSKEHTEEGSNVKWSERSYGSFSRTIAAPPGLKPESIKASLDNGVLRVELPKAADQPEVQKILVS